MVSGEGPASLDAAATDLIALEKQFAEAVVKADVDQLNNILSDDWIIIGPEGKIITKLGFLDVVRSGALAHSTMESEETRVRVYADTTAVVTALVVTAGTYNGQAFTTRERSSDVFVRQGSHWKCVLTQLTTIAAAK